MKAYFEIDFAINDALNSAIVCFEVDHYYISHSTIKELAKLAFNEVEKKYPNNKLVWFDCTYFGQNMVFINI